MKGKHRHHIIPRHAGGSNDPDNFVYLTIEEHTEAHRKLYEEYGRWEDRLAYEGLSGQIGKDEIWEEIYKNRKTFLGKKHTEETKKKISETKKRAERLGLTKAHNEEWRKNHSEKLMGHTVSEEHRKKVSNSNSKEWVVTHPNSKVEQIRNLRQFCKEHNINDGNLIRWGHTKGYSVLKI